MIFMRPDATREQIDNMETAVRNDPAVAAATYLDARDADPLELVELARRRAGELREVPV